MNVLVSSIAAFIKWCETETINDH